MKIIKYGIIVILLLVAGVVVAGRTIIPHEAEKRFNPVLTPPPYDNVPAAAKALHQQLRVVDLHADSLLWGRNLLERGSVGQLDIPRMIEGNVALQMFTTVIKTPKNMNIDHNSAETDNITSLAMITGWPPRTWTSLKERALYQAEQLHHFAEQSNGRLTLIKTQTELAAFLQNYQPGAGKVAGVLGIEGAHALEAKLENLDELYAAGFRMIGLTHFFDNAVSGSAHGMQQGGLTELGKQIIKKMEELGILVDLAHVSKQGIDDALQLVTKPVVISHTGVKGTCNNNRNLSDDQLRRIAATGGVVGIGFWATAVCGKDAAAIAKAIAYTVTVIGADHVGLGSDFDGAVPVPFDVSGLVQITAALQKLGVSDADIRKIMGENTLRVLAQTLPQS